MFHLIAKFIKHKLLPKRYVSFKWIFVLFFICLSALIFLTLSEINTQQSDLDNTQDFLQIRSNLDYGICTPRKPSREAIRMAKRIYKLDGKLTRCGMGKGNAAPPICNINIIQTESSEMKYSFKVKCNRICKEHIQKHNLQVLTVKKGQTENAGSFKNISALENGVEEVIKENIKNNIHFCIIRCMSNEDGPTITRSQILPIDPRLTIKRDSLSRNKNLVNINILLSDSVSRAHFYRSLPKTIQQFRQWENNRSEAPARIFDFELFQAVEGHTLENTYALFNGRMLPLDKKQEERKVKAGTLFGAFHKAGFQTIWQEDLCWKAIWGLYHDLGAKSWDNLQEKLKENFIDHVGLTDSTCEVLEYIYGTTFPFYKPTQICYAGQFQHMYFFNYTLNTIKTIQDDPQTLPLLTYMSTSVGHDDTGRRIQTLDLGLLEYVKELSLLDNTITILMADHGNTYTRYTVDSIEGRFEMFHPHLFLIIPNKVASRLGKKALDTLEVNQQRLITVIDLHQTIMTLRYPLTGHARPKGLFAPVSPERTCSDLELRRPNLCVCDGWDRPVKNDSTKMVFAEFAVGMLNEKLDQAVMKYWNNSFSTLHPRSCIRLRTISYTDVRERHDLKSLYTSMQITVGSANLKSTEKFHVEVKSLHKSNQNSLDIKLSNFDRLSIYGPYKECADQGVPIQLCSCSNQPKTSINHPLDTTEILAPLGHKYLGNQAISKLDSDSVGCLHLISRTYNSISYAYELANVCQEKVYTVEVNVLIKRVQLSRRCPFRVNLQVGTRFLVSARAQNVGFGHAHQINIDVKVLKSKEVV